MGMIYLLTVVCCCETKQIDLCLCWIRQAAGEYVSEEIFEKASAIEFVYDDLNELVKGLRKIHTLSLPGIETTAVKIEGESYSILDNLVDRHNT